MEPAANPRHSRGVLRRNGFAGKVVSVSARAVTAFDIGQIERDSEGVLWTVVYHGDQVIAREPVRSLRKGKRVLADLVLAAADKSPPKVGSRPGHS